MARNVKAILRTANAIEQAKFKTLGFNNGTFYDDNIVGCGDEDTGGRDCGTCACIAGWAIAANGGVGKLKSVYAAEENIAYRAQKILGITCDQRCGLFTDYTDTNITPEVAAQVLRHFAKTGDIEFQKALDGELGA